MSLHDHLLAAGNRDDPVGDLARDYQQGIARGVHGPVETFADFRATLGRLRACDAAQSALSQLQTELGTLEVAR